MFDQFGVAVCRRWPWVLVVWAGLVAAIWLAAPRWDDVTRDGDFAYLPDGVSSVEGRKLREAAFPEAHAKSKLVLVVARPGGPLARGDYRLADRLVAELSPGRDNGPVMGISSPRTEVVGRKLISPVGGHGQALLIIVRLRNEMMAIDNMDWVAGVYAKLDRLRAGADFPPGLELGVTGSAAIGYDMLDSAGQSIQNTELTTILLVILILGLVYRAPGLVIVPLVTIAVSVVVAMGLVAIVASVCPQIGVDFKIFKTTKIFVVTILFGAGTDYCLFLISRYKEELQRGVEPAAAIAQALARVSDALAASALTTVLGLGTMVVADFGKFRNSGPAIALCLVVALLASITLAPALLRAGGRIVFWPFGVVRAGPHRAAEGSPGGDLPAAASPFAGFWRLVGGMIIARPGLILVVSVAVLAPLAWQGLSFEVTYDLVGELEASRRSVQGTRLLGRYFPAGETGPVTVLAYNPAGGFDRPEGRWEKIKQLSDDLYHLEYHGTRPITSVRSLVEPLGEPPQRFGLFGGVRRGVVRGHRRTQSTYLAQAPEFAGKVTRLDLVFQVDPFSRESIRLLDYVDGYLGKLARDPRSHWHGTHFYFLGTTAGIRDLRAVITSDRVLIQWLVPIAVLVVLVVILRRPLICVYLILSVVFGYLVTIGTVKLLFGWLYGDTFHGLDWKVPIFLFVILIAIGQDYNIYLATRVFEEQKRRGTVEGLRVALVRTGGIITSCGVIMAGTFASIGTGTFRAMHELGFALALGVLLDTLLIRTVLVPAFLMLWGRLWEQPARAGLVTAAAGAGACEPGAQPAQPREGTPPERLADRSGESQENL